MDEQAHTYRVIEIAGTSSESISEAIRNGVARANGNADILTIGQLDLKRGRNGEAHGAHQREPRDHDKGQRPHSPAFTTHGEPSRMLGYDRKQTNTDFPLPYHEAAVRQVHG